MFAFTFRNTVTLEQGDTVSTLHTTEHPNFVCFAANKAFHSYSGLLIKYCTSTRDGAWGSVVVKALCY